MENFSNYQEIINAIKAEYVNARNLKKTATAKKRVATNAKSFKTRKEGEKTSLEAKLIAVKSDLDSTLSTSIDNLENAKFNLLKSELAKLEGKLAFIDADIARLDGHHMMDPNNIGSDLYPAKTTTETQTLSVLRNMLQNTVNDASIIIQNLYDGTDYVAIKTATVPTLFTDDEQEVVDHYFSLLSTHTSLLYKVKVELDDFTSDVFAMGASSNQLTRNLIMHSQELVDLKHQLATLLEDQAPESSITNKENEIDSLKTVMLRKSIDLKQLERDLSNRLEPNKLDILKQHATDLYNFTNELESYWWQNRNFLVTRFGTPREYIKKATFSIFNDFFQLLENNPELHKWTNNNRSEFELIHNKIQEAWDEKAFLGGLEMKNHDFTDSLRSLQQIFDCDYRNNGNGEIIISNVVGFKPEVSGEHKDFFLTAAAQLMLATSEYTIQKNRYDVNKDNIQQYIYNFENSFSERRNITSAHADAKSRYFGMGEEYNRLHNGHYTGTQEQMMELDTAFDTFFPALRNKYTHTDMLLAYETKYNLFVDIFPDFYSVLSNVKNAENSAIANANSANTTLEDLITSKHAAYDYLQTLTVGETDYVAALADYEAKVAAYDLAYADWVNKTDGPGGHEEAYAFLQTTLAGEAEYQAAVVDLATKSDAYNLSVIEANNLQNALNNAKNASNAFTEGTPEYIAAYADYVAAQTAYDSFNNDVLLPATTLLNEADALVVTLIPSHYIYLGAQSDNDSKVAIKQAAWAVVENTEVLKNDAYAFLQDLTDEDAAYQAALTDWNSKDDAQNLFYNDTYTPAQQALQAAVDAKNQHLNNNYGSEFNVWYNGYTLAQILDDRENAQIDADNSIAAFNSAEQALSDIKSSMTFVPSTPLEKRDAMKLVISLTNKEKQSKRIDALVNNNLNDLYFYHQQISSFVGFVNWRDSIGFDGLRNDIMNFLTNSSYNNAYSHKQHQLESIDFDIQKINNTLSGFDQFVLGNNQIFGSPFSELAKRDNQSDIISTFTSNRGIQYLSESVRELNDTFFRSTSGEWFADRIMDEVNNGTPIV